mgnify:CR=1 FL=1|jgi:hypothetical protein|tara:strand:- start:3153 stop:3836 length:684 start_codon:yes stop_codon:yes gene_type:complete
MKNQYYGFELKDMVRQFITAFNEIVINRYNRSKDVVDQIKVGFYYGPKERALHDIVNKAQSLKLPTIAVHYTSISRDSDRVFNKIPGFYYTKAPSVSGGAFDSDHLKTPIPVNIGISMSIMTKFQTDMDQILSNFVPYTNPYIIISWKVPTTQNLVNNLEIRTEVLWDGTLSLDYPVEVSGTQPARIIANTSFTMKGWLFKGPPTEDTKNIFTIDQDFVPVNTFNYE